jgi:hypothetical protein
MARHAGLFEEGGGAADANPAACISEALTFLRVRQPGFVTLSEENEK